MCSKFEALKEELAKEREKERERELNHANYIRTSQIHEARVPIVSTPLECQQYYMRDPCLNLENARQNSVGSLESHQFGSTGHDTPRLVPTLLLEDVQERCRYDRDREYATNDR